MSSISSVSSSYASMMPPARGQRPDPAKMAEDIFSKLDTKARGYIQKSDLQNALNAVSASSSTSSSSGTSSSVDDLFTRLDSDSDGKVTRQELSDSMKSLADALDSQAMSARMGMGGAGGMPPPPPGGSRGKDDAGFTQDELSSMASDVASTDSQRSRFMSDVASNFDKADADGDGKVSFKEAMAYEQSTQTGSSSTGTAGTRDDATGATSTQETQARMMQQLMQLIHAYGDADQDSQHASISASA